MLLSLLIISLAASLSLAFQNEDVPMTKAAAQYVKEVEPCGCGRDSDFGPQATVHRRSRLDQRAFESPVAVMRLGMSEFQEVTKSSHLGIVAYVTSSCGHSISQYSDAVQNLPRSTFPAYVIDCDNSTLSYLCPACPKIGLGQQASLDTLPVQILPWKIMVKLEHDGKNVLESISKHIPNYVDELSTMSEVDQWLKKYNGAHRVLVAVEDDVSLSKWKITAAKFLGNARFATIGTKVILPHASSESTWKFKIYEAKASDSTGTYTHDVDFDHLLRNLKRLDPPSESNDWADIYQETRFVTKKLLRKAKNFTKKLESSLWRIRRFLVKIDAKVFRKIRQIIVRVDWGFFVTIVVAARILMRVRRRLGVSDRLLRGSVKLLLFSLPSGLWRVVALLWTISTRLVGAVWKIM